MITYFITLCSEGLTYTSFNMKVQYKWYNTIHLETWALRELVFAYVDYNMIHIAIYVLARVRYVLWSVHTSRVERQGFLLLAPKGVHHAAPPVATQTRLHPIHFTRTPKNMFGFWAGLGIIQARGCCPAPASHPCKIKKNNNSPTLLPASSHSTHMFWLWNTGPIRCRLQ